MQISRECISTTAPRKFLFRSPCVEVIVLVSFSLFVSLRICLEVVIRMYDELNLRAAFIRGYSLQSLRLHASRVVFLFSSHAVNCHQTTNSWYLFSWFFFLLNYHFCNQKATNIATRQFSFWIQCDLFQAILWICLCEHYSGLILVLIYLFSLTLLSCRYLLQR